MREIDHIVYCVDNLAEAVDYFNDLLGIRATIGGSHLNHGTKNALINLDNECYLEILTIDEDNKDFVGDRWMGIDLLQSPKITRWAIKSNNLSADSSVLNQHSSSLGVIDGGCRMTGNGKLLSWNMILPTASPEVDLLPFMTDWSQSEMHPTDSLKEKCTLAKIDLFHPKPSEIQPILLELGIEFQIHKADEVRISIEVDSPNGIKVIG